MIHRKSTSQGQVLIDLKCLVQPDPQMKLVQNLPHPFGLGSTG